MVSIISLNILDILFKKTYPTFSIFEQKEEKLRALSTKTSLAMAAPTDQRIAVPIDDPNADTEW